MELLNHTRDNGDVWHPAENSGRKGVRVPRGQRGWIWIGTALEGLRAEAGQAAEEVEQLWTCVYSSREHRCPAVRTWCDWKRAAC